MTRYCYVIAGAGSAGCVLANRLSADPRTKVLLVEAGGPDRHPMFHVPKGSGMLMENDKYAWRYRTTAFGPNQRSEFWTRGKVLGGSSSINGMVYNRGNRADYDELERLGNKGWGWNDILPIFKGFEDNEFGASPTRGVGGPLHVSVGRGLDPLCGEIIGAGTRAGLRELQDINESDDPRIGYATATIRKGRRVSAVDAFLKPAKRRDNLDVVTNTTVRRLIIENDRAVGIEVRAADGTMAEFRAKPRDHLRPRQYGQSATLAAVGHRPPRRARRGRHSRRRRPRARGTSGARTPVLRAQAQAQRATGLQPHVVLQPWSGVRRGPLPGHQEGHVGDTDVRGVGVLED
jgi:choline dehydrogenase-like flavoprotein